ncbi:DUF6289 family protein [Catellatospora tritici]|uniref:DUF6289 family protein n=1 Tax=Catellatospora tritici TaxID=2851566 RepID=UPI001C2D7AFE|nr:DUF6289 family protein [Catellatospora tritici]MBV1853605.1 hypothetical protein [Catellatospora tritici]
MRRSRTRTRIAAVAAAVCLGLVGAATPAHANGTITFVAYFSDAAHTNLVGGSTFSECPGDPSYHWGAYTAYYTIESEPCP